MGKKTKFKEKEPGTFIGHCACPLEGCESTDAGSYYEHEDGSYSFSCFSCGGSIVNFDVDNMTPVSYGSNRIIDWEAEMEKLEEIRDGLICINNKERKIFAETYELYGCRMELDQEGNKIETIYYPTYRVDEAENYTHVGYRNRKRFKEGSKEVLKDPTKLGKMKDFAGGIGDVKKGICLFGQWLFSNENTKRIILCCGEEDAMASYWMTDQFTKFNGGYPCVSTPSGENVNGIKPHLRYLCFYDEIYLVADQDEAGRKFESELCKLLPVGKVRLVRLPKGIKDPCDLLKSANTKDKRKQAAKTFWNSLWSATKYSPAGIMSLSEGWNSYVNRGKDTLLRFPDSFGDLNEKTHGGYALGEIVNIIAPSSVGKSSFVKEMIYETVMNTAYNVGVISLEETIDEFIEGILSIHMDTQLNEIPYDQRDRGTEYKKFQELIHHYPEEYDNVTEDKSERIHFLDHQGACEGEELLNKVDFLINGLDCKMIILDPVTLACSGGDTDEDDMASDIVKRVKRHKVAWVNVHHVRKNSGSAKANSEGADLAEEDIKGCTSADTEYLTPTGWKRIDEYVDGDLIAEYDPKTKTTKFIEPKEYVVMPCEEGFYHLKTTKGIDTMVSSEHTMYYQKQRSDKLHSIKAKDLVEKHKKLSQGFRGRFETATQGHSFNTIGLMISNYELQLAVAFQADGTIRDEVTGSVEFNLKKERKKERLRSILIELGIPYYEGVSGVRKGYSTFSFKMAKELIFKEFPSSWWNLNKEQSKVVLNEVFKWDGCEGNFRAYFSNSKVNCDYIQYLAMSFGIRSVVNKEAPPSDKSKRTGECYWCRLVEKSSSTVSLTHKDGPLPIEKVEAEDGLKYCFVTSTGAWVSRRNGRVMMTGNTGAWFQTGMINLIFTRNKVHEDPIVRNTTKIKMSKCRRHGKNTGIAGYIHYNGETGRLERGMDVEALLEAKEKGQEIPLDSPVMGDEWS